MEQPNFDNLEKEIQRVEETLKRLDKNILDLRIAKAKLTQSIPMDAEVKPACEKNCKTCINFEIYNGDNMVDWCSQWCVYITSLHRWDVTKDYCNKFESKSV